MTNSYDLVSALLLGGILGIIGQGIRIIVGLKKLNDKRALDSEHTEAFTNNRLFVSIFIGFIAGALAVLVKMPNDNAFSQELIMGIMAAGYAGADFIEGIFSTYFKKSVKHDIDKPSNTAASKDELPAATQIK